MRILINGFEIIAGTSSKTNKPYDMSRIHTLIPLQPSENAKGSVGTQYDCPSHVLDKIRNLNLPFEADVEVQDVMSFGKRQQQIMSITPVKRAS